MAAVLMDYAGAQGRPVQQLANAKSSAQARAAVNSARPVPGPGMPMAGREAAPGWEAAPIERATPAEQIAKAKPIADSCTEAGNP